MLMASLISILVYQFISEGQFKEHQIEFVPLPLQTKLTAERCAQLSEGQIIGTEALESGTNPLTLANLTLSMKLDIKKHNFMGIGAMHYDIPLCVIIANLVINDPPGVPELVEMYNLKIIGYEPASYTNWETSSLCENGTQKYQVERFSSIYARWTNSNARNRTREFEGAEARILQQLFWTNRGDLPCKALKIREFAKLVLEINNLKPT